MPSVYDFHHIELDKVGRGKKRISYQSPDGGIKSALLTSKSAKNGHSVTDSMNGSPVGSRPASRRGSRAEDTKTRLFGPPDETPRRIRDIFKSTIFVVDSSVMTPQKVISPKIKAKYTPARRNPITGDVVDNERVVSANNGTNSLDSSSRGSPSIASSSLSIDSSSLSSLPSN